MIAVPNLSYKRITSGALIKALIKAVLKKKKSNKHMFSTMFSIPNLVDYTFSCTITVLCERGKNE